MPLSKKAKIFIGIGVALVAAAGVYVAIAKPFKKKEEEAPETPPAEEGKTVTQQVNTPKQSGVASVLIKKLAKKPEGFSTPSPTPTKTTTPVKTGGGQKVWVYAKMNGVKVHRKSTKKGVSLGPLYNTYNNGKIIGTFAGTTSVGGEKFIYVNDGTTPLIVSEKLIYKKTF